MPTITHIPVSGNYDTQAFEIVNAKYETAASWATWATKLLEDKLTALANNANSFGITELVTAAGEVINNLPSYVPGVIATYDAPTAPVYDAIPAYTAPTKPTLQSIPAYVAPTLGTLNTTLPTVHDIAIPSAPSAVVAYTKADFSSAFHDAILAKVQSAMADGNTGLGAAVETAMFEREIARQNRQRAAAYTELTTQYASRGFPQPPGALYAKQTEVNNESSLRLTDSSTGILEQSTKLAQQYNIAAMQLAAQLDATIVTIWNSAEERAFNKAKADVDAAITVFAETVRGAVGVAQLDVAKLQAFVATNDATAKIYELQVNAQIEPMKALISLNSALVQQYSTEVQANIAPMTAIASSNVSKAESYKASVSGASANVQASIAVEDSKAKAYSMNLQKASAVAELTVKESHAAIDAAARAFQVRITALQGSATAAAQMVASSLNGVNVSSSYNFGASYGGSENLNMTATNNIYKTQAM